MMENQVLERLGESINFLKELNLLENQKDIATALGYKREGTISEIVKGKVPLTEKFITSFCSFYSVSADYIKYGKGDVFVKGSNIEQSLLYQELKKKKERQVKGGYTLEDVVKILEQIDANLIYNLQHTLMNEAIAKAHLRRSAENEAYSKKRNIDDVLREINQSAATYLKDIAQRSQAMEMNVIAV